MDHFVHLERLPDGLAFPSEMEGRIEYDASRQTLIHCGPMSKCAFDRLFKLHNDSEYRRAVESLFQKATFEAEDDMHARTEVPIAVAGGVLVLVIAALVIWCIVC
jgi:hypothetical protein